MQLQCYGPRYLLELSPLATGGILLTQQLTRLPCDVGARVQHQHLEVGAVLNEPEHSVVCGAQSVTEVELLGCVMWG